MDIWGVSGVEAEAELLAAIVATFTDMGLTSKDVGIKVPLLVSVSLLLLRTGAVLNLGEQPADTEWSDGCGGHTRG